MLHRKNNLHGKCILIKINATMQLTRFSDYALRLLMYVARGDGTRPITIAEVGLSSTLGS